MTSLFSTGLAALVDQLQEQERKLGLVQEFADNGGEYRLTIHVDHPDPAVRAAVLDVAARNIPSELLIRGFLKFAKEETEAARDRVVSFTKINTTPSTEVHQ